MIPEGSAMHPPRSVLFLPASNARAIEKARGLDCDVVMIDLEDAVGPDDKATAREAAVAALAAGGFAAPVVAVRANGLDTDWGEADLAALREASPAVVLMPKVGGPADLEAARERLGQGPRLWANIETCAGVLALAEISRASRALGVEAYVFGQNDLSRDMGFRPARDRRPLHAAMSLTVTAARACGAWAIDGVFNDFSDLDALGAECREGRAFGFHGKALIHPAQIAAAHAAYAPSQDDVAWARAVTEAFADPENAGKGAVRVQGAMAERLHLEQAQRILALTSR